MEAAPIVLLIIVVIGLFIAIAVYAHKKEKEREAALAAWAMENGWSYRKEKERGFDSFYKGFKQLRQGSNRYAHNIIQGEFEGRGLTTFDYHYETHSTDSKGNRQTHHHRFSAIILGTTLPLKPLFIRPEGFFDKMAGAFGFDDIDFESAEFSRKFHVSSPDRKWAYDVLHARAIEYIMDLPKKYTIGFDRDHVFICEGQRRWKPPEFVPAVRVVDTLLDMLPEYVKQQQREQA